MLTSAEFSQLLSTLGAQERHAGLRLFREGRLLIELERGDETATRWRARLKLGQGQSVKVDLSIRREAKRLRMAETCSCLLGGSCPHVAALLWSLMADRRDEEAWEREQGLDQELLPPPPPPVQTTPLPAYRLLPGEREGEPGLQILRVELDPGSQGGRAGTRAYPEAYLEHLTEAVDRDIDALLRQELDQRSCLRLSAPALPLLLEHLLDTERCFVGERALRLHRTAARQVTWSWQQEQERWSFSVPHVAGEQLLLRARPVQLLDLRDASLCVLDSTLAADAQDQLVAHGVWQEEELLAELPQLRPRLQAWGIAVPAVLTEQEWVRGELPGAQLRLYRHRSLWQGVVRDRLLAHLCFIYAGHSVPALPTEARSVLRLSDRRVLIERQRQAEQQLLSCLMPLQPMLRTLGWQCPEEISYEFGLRHDDIESWLPFLARLPELLAEGWRIDIDDDFPWNFTEIDLDDWESEVREEGDGWFDLSLRIDVGGQRVALLPLLIQALEAMSAAAVQALLSQEITAEAHLTVLHRGKLLRLPLQRLHPLLTILGELLEREPKLAFDGGGSLRLNRLDAAEFLQRSASVWQGGEALQKLGRELADFTGVEEVEAPPTLLAELRPYQRRGLSWMQFLDRHGLSGLLADDMGLGKTLQTIAHLCVLAASGRLQQPAMIVCPKSVLPNWRHELERFAPHLRVLSLEGQRRDEAMSRLAEQDVVLTSYTLLARDVERLCRQPFRVLVCDEAQQIKNHRTQSARAIRRLQVTQRLALTGTPMENHLGELWSLFDMLLPGYLGHESLFRRLFRHPIEKGGDSELMQRLGRRIKPFMLRRTKVEVATELPAKTEIIQNVLIQDEQRDLYELVRASMDSHLRQLLQEKGLGRASFEILEALLKLRQVCCDPRLIKDGRYARQAPSAKLDYLMEVLPAMLEEGRRILLFSQFTSMLDLIAEALRQAGIDFVTLTGSTSDRETPVRRFQAGEVPLFLLSLKAGGVGLNLTAADTVFIYDPWWNPAVENQAIDRAYRIGQDKPVFIYKLVCEGTVEERIIALQKRKADLAEGVYGDAARLNSLLTAEDLAALFRPLTAELSASTAGSGLY